MGGVELGGERAARVLGVDRLVLVVLQLRLRVLQRLSAHGPHRNDRARAVSVSRAATSRAQKSRSRAHLVHLAAVVAEPRELVLRTHARADTGHVTLARGHVTADTSHVTADTSHVSSGQKQRGASKQTCAVRSLVVSCAIWPSCSVTLDWRSLMATDTRFESSESRCACAHRQMTSAIHWLSVLTWVLRNPQAW